MKDLLNLLFKVVTLVSGKETLPVTYTHTVKAKV